MRYTKILLLGMSALALAFGTAGAGLNPQNPGLAGGTTFYNPGASRICIDCHSRVPSSSANNGTHFVTAGSTTHDTRTGGGWAGSRFGVRDGATGGQYFKISAWPNPVAARGNVYSKYSNAADNVTYIFGARTDNTGLATAQATAATFGGYEIICESCHNIVSNVAGGNNLLAPMSGAYVAGGGNLVQASPWSVSDEATLCVGCHGFLYATNATNQPRYADTRKSNEVTAGEKQNNHQHYINGAPMAQNHHVMTGDTITQTIAAQGLYWADTLVKDTSAAGWLPAASAVTTTGVVNTRGTMPMIVGAWTNDGGKIKSTTATQINCVHCHAAPHSGDATTAASILRDTNAQGTITAANSISRIGENGRTWMGFNDFNYCQDCHKLR